MKRLWRRRHGARQGRSETGMCPLCPWPMFQHDQDFSFVLPDEIAEWDQETIAERTSRMDSFLTLDRTRIFMRVLVPVSLEDEHVVTFGIWLEVDSDTAQRAAEVWDTPGYAAFECSGSLANDLPPWPGVAFGAVVHSRIRELKELPYAASSDDAGMNDILSRSWPHGGVLGPMNGQAPEPRYS